MTNNNKNVYARIVGECGTPVFIYSEPALKKNIARIQNAIRDSGLGNQVSIFVAYFTNSSPHLFRILERLGVGATLQSIEECYQLEKLGLGEITKIVSPTALSDEDLQFIIDMGIPVNVTLPEELEYALNRTDKVGLRIDISQEQNQRTGLKISEFCLVKEICDRLGREISAIHTYPGTGSELDKLIKHAEETFKVYKEYFHKTKEINLGGGFAFNYDATTPEGKHFPWDRYFCKLKQLAIKYSIPKDVRISIEPGRDVFADTGEFVIKINRLHKRPNEEIARVYTDGSYAHMPSATIKGRQHQLKFLDKSFNEMNGLTGLGELSGCTSLSRDYIFPGIVRIPESLSKGDYILVQDIGAYGATQHMEFLNKRPAPEVLVRESGAIEMISKRGEYSDKTRNVPIRPIAMGDNPL